jgi:outer membrane lipoprotein-sorting protein
MLAIGAGGIVLAAVVTAGGLAAAGPKRADEILVRAEAVRNPDGAYGLDMTITTSHPKREEMVSTFVVYTNGRQRTLAYQTSPPAFAGRRMLMVDREAWLFLPGARAPFHVFLQHIVTGEVASGDIARIDLSTQHVAALLREEKLDGTPCYVLELTARNPATTYPRILYWVSKRRHRPLKAEFYALSGRLMKTGWFDDFREALGGVRPMRLVLQDAGDFEYRSVLEFSNFRRTRIPDALFVPEALAEMFRPPEEGGGTAGPGERAPAGGGKAGDGKAGTGRGGGGEAGGAPEGPGPQLSD